MVKYEDTKIYYIAVGDERYYGHTAEKYLSARESRHRVRFREGAKYKVYEAMRGAGMTDKDLHCVWVEDYPCDDVNQATARERWWIENHGTSNMKVPNRTHAEWREANRERKSEMDRAYREKNRDTVLQKKREYHHKNKEAISANRKTPE